MEQARRARAAPRGLWWLVAGVAIFSGGAAGGAEPREAIEATPSWRFVTGGSIRFAPAVSPDGTIYCVSDDRLLRAVSSEGREIWRFPLGARPAAAPILGADGSIVVSTADGSLRLLGPQGKLRWNRALEASPVAAPARGADGSVYLPLESGSLMALDGRGGERWTFRLKAAIVAPPSVGADGTIYVSTADRLFHALSPDGAQLWSAALPGTGGSAAIGRSGVVYVSAFGIHAFSPKGSLEWEFGVPFPTTDPVVAPDATGRSTELVIVGAGNGAVHVIDARGARVQEIELAGSLTLPPAIRADGAIVVTSSRGLYRVQPGKPQGGVALLRARSPMSSPVLAQSGMVLAGSEDWVLYACDFGDHAPGVPPAAVDPALFWPQPRHDAGQSGRARAGAPDESPAYVILRELAGSSLRSGKEQVLEAVRRHFAGESFLPLTAAQLESLLVYLAQEGAQSPVYVGERGSADAPDLRAAACELLGELGTERSRRALISVVEKDPRSEVQSRAAAALGGVAYDPDGRSSRALGRLAERSGSDEGLLLVVVRALAGVAAATGPGLGLGDAPGPGKTVEESAADLAARPAWQALVTLAAGGYPAGVRSAAREALAELVRDLRKPP